jgi:tetratricopeptide (TPR) repeat protein
VISTVSAVTLVRDKLPISEIAEMLKVRYLVTGEIFESGEKIQARVRLVEAPMLTQVWSANFTESSDNIFALQERIAASIIPQVWTNIDINERHKSLTVPLKSRSSYELYWRADALFRKLDQASSNQAVAIAGELVRTNPDSAWAYAMSAFCNGTAYANGWTTDPVQTRDLALAHYQNALRLDHDNVQVLGYAAGTLVAVGGSMVIADKLIGRALTLLPDHSSTLFWGGWVDLIGGRPERARQRLARGLEITPIWAVRAYALAGIGLSHLLEGQIDKAYELLFEAYVQAPDYPFSAAGLCIAAAAKSDRKTAGEVGKRLIATGKDEQVLRMLQNPVHRAMFAHALASATAA